MITCPECGSKNISRKYASFWAVVDENGDDLADFQSHCSETELTEDALCRDCDNEFKWD